MKRAKDSDTNEPIAPGSDLSLAAEPATVSLDPAGPPASAQIEITAGAILGGRYRLERELGRGGMGAVWAATHLVTLKPVALKLLHRAGATIVDRERMVREARAAARIRHPNVVGVHDVVEAPGGAPALVMDLLEGEPLAARLARAGALSVRETAMLLGPVVSAIAAAHCAGVVHRDLKPHNLFLERGADGQLIPRVLDFGTARIFDPGAGADASNVITAEGVIVGTPAYMAPEQAFGDRDVDARADVWALGVVLYECLAGRRPFEGAETAQLMRRIALGEYARLEEAAPAVPPQLAAAIARMLSVSRADRPASLDEIQSLLRKYAASSTVELANEPAATSERPASRHGLLLVGFAVTAIVAASLFMGLVSRRSPVAAAPSSISEPESSKAPAAATSSPPASPELAPPVIDAGSANLEVPHQPARRRTSRSKRAVEPAATTGEKLDFE